MILEWKVGNGSGEKERERKREKRTRQTVRPSLLKKRGFGEELPRGEAYILSVLRTSGSLSRRSLEDQA